MRPIALVAAVAAGCGPSQERREPADLAVADVAPDLGCDGLECFQMMCPGGAKTTVSGRVFAPNGKDPIFDALVFVPRAVKDFPPTIGCEACSDPIGGAPIVRTASKVDGAFTLEDVPVARQVPVVLQKGRFRRILRLDIKPCVDNPIPDDLGKLPRSQIEGDLPRIAVGVGDFDQIECVLRAIGIDRSEFTAPSGNGAIHLYGNSDKLRSGDSIASLLRDPGRMARYNLIFIGCAVPTFAGLMSKGEVKSNLFNYVNAGGRLYVTDYSYDYVEQVPPFAPYVYFDGGGDVIGPQPAGAAQGIWNGSPLPAMVTDPSLLAWLKALGQTKAGEVQIQDAFAMALGTAADQRTYPSTTWVRGAVKGVDRPHTVTFDYNQCGKVLWSSYHTREPGGSSGTFPTYCLSDPARPESMIAQEKILEFLIFQISACVGTL